MHPPSGTTADGGRADADRRTGDRRHGLARRGPRAARRRPQAAATRVARRRRPALLPRAAAAGRRGGARHPVGTAKSRLHRALAEMRSSITADLTPARAPRPEGSSHDHLRPHRAPHAAAHGRAGAGTGPRLLRRHAPAVRPHAAAARLELPRKVAPHGRDRPTPRPCARSRGDRSWSPPCSSSSRRLRSRCTPARAAPRSRPVRTGAQWRNPSGRHRRRHRCPWTCVTGATQPVIIGGTTVDDTPVFPPTDDRSSSRANERLRGRSGSPNADGSGAHRVFDVIGDHVVDGSTGRRAATASSSLADGDRAPSRPSVGRSDDRARSRTIVLVAPACRSPCRTAVTTFCSATTGRQRSVLPDATPTIRRIRVSWRVFGVRQRRSGAVAGWHRRSPTTTWNDGVGSGREPPRRATSSRARTRG